MRVLYVEDNRQLREAIAMLLEGEGQEVTTCVTAEEAIELESQHTFDLVITDITLPGISGLELSARLLAQNPKRWIVLCSGHQLEDEITQLGGSNVHALLKPFGLEELEALIGNAQASMS